MSPKQVALLETIVGHLHAAKIQRSPLDDQIIAEHIEDAYEAAADLFHSMGRGVPGDEGPDPMRGVEFPFADNH